MDRLGARALRVDGEVPVGGFAAGREVRGGSVGGV